MTDTDAPLPRATLLGLVAMGLAVLVIANDFTALTVALPAMEAEFGADVTTVQWVVNGYALVFGVLIVTGGRLADMFGRRRIFFIGSGIFALFSVVGGIADSVATLLACRALMGVGGAMMWPAILGMTYAMLPADRAGLAGGLILGAAGFGNAVGPLLGGMLTDTLGWRWIFFLNLPIAAFAVLVTWYVVRDDEPTLADHGIDYGGIATLSVGLVALLYALDYGVDAGWTSSPMLALYVLSATSLAGFALIERRAGAQALVPMSVLANRGFVAACLTVLLMSAIFFASLLYLPQLLTKSMQLSAFAAGAGLLPMMATYAATSFVSGPLYERFGPKVIVSLGAAGLALGIFMLSRVEPATTFRDLIPGMVILGVGVGLFYSSITTAAVTALDPSQASLAGGIVYMFQIAGGSLGLGLNTAIVVGAPSLVDGVREAFLLDSMLAVAGLAVAILFVGGPIDRALHRQPDHHRAHSP